MENNFSSRKKLWIVFIASLIIFILLVVSIFHECRTLAINEAEKNLEGFLLSHRAIRSFVEQVQKEEIYRLKRQNLLYEDYFSPKLLSSTFIARNIKDAQNLERKKRGLDELYFKFASSNPRNPINQADVAEQQLLYDFNHGNSEEYRAVVDTAEGESLYYAIPVGRNVQSCMHCHGLPEDAPKEMLEKYGSIAGFHEKVGDIRALMSVRVPLAGLMKEADRTALLLSLFIFVLFVIAFWLVYIYLRKMDFQELIKIRLQKAEKMESIGLMAGGVAHDLNNILAGIINYPELMLRKIPQDSDLRGSLIAIQQSGQRAAAVVADLLTVARGVAVKKELVDLNLLIKEHLNSPEFFKLKADWPEIDFSADLSSEKLSLLCSPIHLKKSFVNLLTNAYEANLGKGKCQLSTGLKYFPANEAKQYNAAVGEYVYIKVTDTGSGIKETDLPHIFEPFYSTKKMGKSGTGLGLSVVWNTVKDHQGIVTVDSDNSGTAFVLYFPLAFSEPSLPEIQAPFSELMGCQERILVVDDEPHLRDIAAQMLTELNYSVRTVSSGEDAVLHLSSEKTDLVLLDMLMEPGMNGRQSYEQIIKLQPDQKAVVVSGFSASSDVKETLALGAGGFIKKPYSIIELGKVVKDVLSKKKD